MRTVTLNWRCSCIYGRCWLLQAFGGRRGLFAGRTRPASTSAAPVTDESGSTAASSEAPAPR